MGLPTFARVRTTLASPLVTATTTPKGPKPKKTPPLRTPDIKKSRTRVTLWVLLTRELAKSQIVLKLRGARMRKRAKEGRCEGRKPFGYYDGEAAALERLRTLRAEGLGFDRIAARMNEEGIPTRTGKRWHGVVINRLLTGKRR